MRVVSADEATGYLDGHKVVACVGSLVLRNRYAPDICMKAIAAL